MNDGICRVSMSHTDFKLIQNKNWNSVQSNVKHTSVVINENSIFMLLYYFSFQVEFKGISTQSVKKELNIRLIHGM